MDNHNIKRVFDQVKLSPQQEEVLLERLLRNERRSRPMRQTQKTAAALVAAAMLVMTCAFTMATRLDQRILAYFNGTQEDAQQLSSGIVEVGHSFRYDNGWTVDVHQVLADQYSVMVLAEVIAPEGMVLDKEHYYFELGMELTPQTLDQEGVSGWGYGPVRLEDEDPTDNRLTFLCSKALGETPKQDGTNPSVTLRPQWLHESEGRGQLVDFSQQEQSYVVELEGQESGKTYTLNVPIQMGEETMTLEQMHLSPISLAFCLRGSENDPRMLGPSEMTRMEEGAVLHLADGTTVAVRRVTSQVYDQNTGVADCVYQMEQIIDPEQVVSVTLLGQTFSIQK